MENNQSNKAKNGITYNHVGVSVLRSSYPPERIWNPKKDNCFNNWAKHIHNQLHPKPRKK